jgi:hypothetical protein
MTNDLKWHERLRLKIVRILLSIIDRLLKRNPNSLQKFIEQKNVAMDSALTEAVNKKMASDIAKVLIPPVPEPTFEETKPNLAIKDIDFNLSNDEKASDDLIMFYAELENLIEKHMVGTSALVIAGPLMAHSMKIYRTVLPQNEYDQILYHVYNTRNKIEPIILPDSNSPKTIH